MADIDEKRDPEAPGSGGKFTYTDPDGELTFAWPGDAYIDVFQKGQWYPVKSINVWNYQEEGPTIERTQAAFEAKCRAWLEEHGTAFAPETSERNDNR